MQKHTQTKINEEIEGVSFPRDTKPWRNPEEQVSVHSAVRRTLYYDDIPFFQLAVARGSSSVDTQHFYQAYGAIRKNMVLNIDVKPWIRPLGQ